MSDALLPAAIAASGGSSLLAGIYLYERHHDDAMRAGRRRHELRFPTMIDDKAALAGLEGLAGSGPFAEFVFETQADPAGIRHVLAIPERSSAAAEHLAGTVPGLRLSDATWTSGAPSTLAVRTFVRHGLVLKSDGLASATRRLLAPLADLAEGEVVVVRWAVRPDRLVVAERSGPSRAGRDLERVLRKRASETTFAVSGLVLVRAGSVARARALARGITQAIRARQSRGRVLRLTEDRSGRSLSALPRTHRRSGHLTATELLGLIAWPLDADPIAGLERSAGRELHPPRDLPQTGRRLFVSRRERMVALSPTAQSLHEVVVGPTGSGKSTMLARGILDDIAAGSAGLVVDPKDGSLIRSVINRVPAAHADRVVVMQPGRSSAPLGLDVFGAGDADLRAEVLTSTLRSIYAPMGAWGVRSDAYIAMALRTVATLPTPSLLTAGRLLIDPALRRKAISQLNDPVLGMAWAAFEDLSAAEQREHVAAPLNRIMGLLQRPAVREALAQPAPRVDLASLWQERRWLLIDLAPGVLGEQAARLLGAIVSFLAWSALETRSGSAAARVPTSLVFDELQALSELPVSLERLAERARGFGGRLVVGTQTTSRLPSALADAVFGNFATLVTFRASAAEAQRLAREIPGLASADLMALSPYAVAGRVATGTGTGVASVTGSSLPLGPPQGQARRILDASAAHFGTPRAELDAAFRELAGGGSRAGDATLQPGLSRRRP